eukprot:gnl/TRDRNA2_/TRDRNA2_85877_c0_seq1.p1 gnl/TRDRNA2_/TRDRNA2_85877_c0~~gnl/TRDRNA2_/TRDRNA2_85877_c0_seq1.p1  ORF type:complete len:217 (+),score=32.10 gnl/TRDRNA2_/TRDRNA2_85877_c0_seq1:101-751(+)
MSTMASADLVRCAQLAEEASELEAKARELDGYGRSTEAVPSYLVVAARLKDALARCPEGHQDRRTMAAHISEVEARAAYLESLHPNLTPEPVERHISTKVLTLTVVPHGVSTGARTLGFLAMMGAMTGLTIFGPRSAVLLAVGAAHTATRDDSAGHALRQVGRGGSEATSRALRRALFKLRKRDIRQKVLCKVGEMVFATRATLGALAIWRPRQSL